MRAVVLRAFGPPDVLHVEDVPRPVPGPDEVLLRVRAVSVNRTLDLAVRRGTYRPLPGLPHVLGADPSGIVEATGAEVTRIQPGQRVAVISAIRCGTCEFCRTGDDADCRDTRHIGLQRWGGYAEYVAVPQRAAFTFDERLDFPTATAVARHAPTAFQQIERRAGLQPGEWVLVMGAAGSLGSASVQVARLLGGRVIAAAGSDERVRTALDLGAHHGINYRATDLAAEVMRITGGHGADVVSENIGDPTLWPGAFESLAYRGRLVTAGAHGGGRVELDVSRLYRRRLRIYGAPGASGPDVERSLRAAEEGLIRPVIDRVMPLEAAAEAHALLEGGERISKIVLTP